MNRLSTVAFQFYAFVPALLGAATVAGCASEPGTSAEPVASTSTLLASLAPQPITFEIDAGAGGTIAGRGTSFGIAGGTIFVPGGTPADLDTDGDGVPDSRKVRGRVRVTLRELLSTEDMALAGRPTVTSGGELLETGGAFDLTIEGGTQLLQVTALRNLLITPAARPSTPDGMEVWLADANAPGEFGWSRPPGGSVSAKAIGPSFFVPVSPMARINRPTTSKNIDRPLPRFPRANDSNDPMTVRFAKVEMEDAAVFFFPDGLASVIRLERDEAGAYVSPARMMLAEMTGRLVAVSVADGRYFLDEREVSLGDSRSFLVEPIEVTERALRARLQAR